MLADICTGLRFLRDLPGFLRDPLTPSMALAELRRRLEQRESGFLALVRHAVYDRPASPYLRLLRRAGCEYGDLEREVTRQGIEGALGALHREGVAVSLDEFKGRRPLVGHDWPPAPACFANPLSDRHLPVRTGGSRSGQGTPLLLGLGFVRESAVATCLNLEAQTGGQWTKAVWEVPGAAALYRVLKLSAFGAPAARWFTQVDPGSPDLHPRYRWSPRVVRLGARLAGVRLPAPEHVPLGDPRPIARWMAGEARAGRTPWLRTFPTSAVRLCEAAVAGGIDLAGARFTVSGEPLTAARVAAIRRAGAEVQPRFGSVECGNIAYGCLHPEAPDDLHLLHHLVAVVQDHTAGPGLFLTLLARSAPYVMLNVSLGDQAVLSTRRCGCGLEALGWTTHLRDVRSREKLTAGGMTFLDTDVIRVLEVVLPARFGGGPTDYQLVEEEGADGRPGLRLVVHPRVGPVQPEAVIEAFLGVIGGGSGAERVMGSLWRDADLLSVERRPPLPTASGKIQHLHAGHRAEAPGRRE